MVLKLNLTENKEKVIYFSSEKNIEDKTEGNDMSMKNNIFVS